MRDRIGIAGRIRLTVTDEATGLLVAQVAVENTITDWLRSVLANFLVGSTVYTSSTSSTPSLPVYIAVGTGTGTASNTDIAMFNETYLTRKQYSYRDVFQAFTAQLTLNYQTTDPSGTFTEVGLWDQPTTSTTLSAAVSAGATTLPVTAATAPAVAGSTTPGQYNTIYIVDGTNSEYAAIATTAAAGASSWTLQQGLKYAHNSGVTVVAFTGNLMGHAVLPGQGVTKGTGQALTVQYGLYVVAE